MFLDYAENILQLSVNLIALLMCLFQYIGNKWKGWVYGTAFFLANLMSSYYWTVYMIVMGDSPNVSSFISDFGSNLAYLILLLLVLKMRSREERRFFHPLMLLPIPICFFELGLYLNYGNVLLTVYQVGVMTAISVFSLQSICRHRKNRAHGARRPYVAVTALLIAFCEQMMWFTSCLVEGEYPGLWRLFAFAAGHDDLYFVFSFAESLAYLGLVWALGLTFRALQRPAPNRMDKSYQNILKASYFIVVVVCCVGGVALGAWMRDTLTAGMTQASESSVYDIIPVVLYIISLFVASFAVVIVFVITFSEKIAENNELREARQIAEHSNASKSQFLAQMSHEIRTPINTVLGMNEMILRESKDEAILDYAASIQTAGRTLLSLINSILDFSKIEEGKMEIIPVEYDTSSFINNLVASVAERAKGKGLKLVVDVDENLPSMLYGDDVRLSQVIMNLLTNAVKYTEKGEVRFSIAGGAREKDGIELKVFVKDTGIGIRREDLPRLVESFERLDEVRNRSIEGTGLGMAIVTRLLDMMGSALKVEIVYGEGSTFSFTVVQQVRNDKPIGNYAQRLEVSRGGGDETLLAEEARVLVVDDNDMNLKVANNLLKLFAITPDLAGSGFEAIAFARQKSYHVILLDHMMPKMDGIETLAALKNEGLLDGGTRVIALTANAVNGAKEQYLAAGFDAYLSKPIVVSKLEELLRECLPPEICHIRQTAGGDSPAIGSLPGGDALEALRVLGCDVDAGLLYAAGDRAFYLELVREFAGKAEENMQAIRRDCENNDLHDYQIRAHSLKNAARQIGANALADMAQAQESAAKDGDWDAIRAGADELLSQYEAVGRALNTAAGFSAAQEAPLSAATAPGVPAAEAESILKEASKAVEDFEIERAAKLLRPLRDVSLDGFSLHAPIDEILASLDDFDSASAAEKLCRLLCEIEKDLP